MCRLFSGGGVAFRASAVSMPHDLAVVASGPKIRFNVLVRMTPFLEQNRLSDSNRSRLGERMHLQENVQRGCITPDGVFEMKLSVVKKLL
jgi:hypothetical protein